MASHKIYCLSAITGLLLTACAAAQPLPGVYTLTPFPPEPVPVVAPIVIGYDAEGDIGLVAGDAAPEVAKANTEKLNLALAAQWAGGKFKFKDGTVGPVLKPIHCAAKEFFFVGPIQTSDKVGGGLWGFGSRPYILMESNYAHPASIGGAATRLTRIDGENGGPVIRLRGAGFTLSGMELKGCRFGVAGKKSDSVIEVEGRDGNSSGKHALRDLNIGGAKYGIHTRPGYYDAEGKFVELGSGRGAHADESVVANVYCYGIESFFRSDNEQSAGWSFRDIFVVTSGVTEPVVVFDMFRGGKISADNIICNLPAVTLLRVHYPSWNVNRYSITNFWWDNFDFLGPQKGQRLTLFDYTFTDPRAHWYPLDVRVTGHIANTPTNYPLKELVKFNPKLGTATALTGFDRLLFDITNLPQTDGDKPMFTRLGAWSYPNKEYFAPGMAP